MNKQRATTGIIILVVAAFFFMLAQSQLNALAAERESLLGLGGVAQDVGDALGLTRYSQTRGTWVVIRALSFAGILGGGITAVSGYLQRNGSN